MILLLEGLPRGEFCKLALGPPRAEQPVMSRQGLQRRPCGRMSHGLALPDWRWISCRYRRSCDMSDVGNVANQTGE